MKSKSTSSRRRTASTASTEVPESAMATSRPKLPWTDFHTVLAIAREGSVARACVNLGVTHATLLRKLDQIETRLQTRLFDRVRGRYTLTDAGQGIEEAALAMEPVARAAEVRVRGQDLRPAGHVRVSVASIVIEHLLVPVLAQFASAFPEVTLELVSARELVSIRRREADVAIRIADAVPDWLVGRKLADLAFRIYARRTAHRPELRPLAELLGQRRWIGFERDARDLKFDRWIESTVPEQQVVLRVDNFSHALTMVQAGLGIALLPEFLGRTVPDIVPLTPPLDALRTPLWLITHAELRNTARVRVLMQALGPALAHAVDLPGH